MPDRRSVIAGAVCAIAAPSASTRAAIQKVSKAKAQYQDKPKGPQSCQSCAQFVAPHRCRTVLGSVSPHGWCMLFELPD